VDSETEGLTYGQQVKLTLIRVLLPLLVESVLFLAVCRPDALTAAAAWVKRQARRGTRLLDEAYVAAFRAEISAWEHGQDA
jgi:hypothetical protein